MIQGLGRSLGLATRLAVGARGPWRVTAILTERCHLRCAFCQLWQKPEAGVPTEEWVRFFRANPQLRWVNLSGGELFAKERLDSLLDAIVDALPWLALLDFPTAGQKPEATEASVRRLLAGPLPRLAVTLSLDGGPAFHDRLRGREGAFERGLETYRRLRALRDRRFSVHVGCTLTEDAEEQDRGLREALHAAFPDFRPERELHFNLAHHSSHYYRNEGFEALPQEAALRLLRARPRGPGAVGWVEWIYGRLAGRALREGFPPTGCEAIRHTVFVGPDLQVRPCSIWDRPLGSLRDHDYSLRRLLDEAPARAARREVEQRRCPGCFTPCEAVPAMLAHPLRSTWRAWREPAS